MNEQEKWAQSCLNRQYGVLPQSQATRALHERETRKANTERKDALALRVSGLIASAAAEKLIRSLSSTVDAAASNAVTASATPQEKKDHLAKKVRDALTAAALADPINSFDCGCDWHVDARETPDSLVASLIWRAA